VSASYRDATAGDIDAVDNVFRTSFCDTFAHLYSDEDLRAFLGKFTAEAWAEEMANPEYAFRLAQADDRVVGYVKLGPLTLPVDAGNRACELRLLYVLKAWHGSGIAAALMDWAIGEARRRGIGALYLTVYTDNHRAMRFYERRGFAAVGRYDFMVGNHADEDIIMRLQL
jgi:GNAT superfamily N-acetyltransferase